MTKIFIDGHHGTTGLKIVNRLKSRDDIELLEIDYEKRHDINERAKLINSSDVTFLCLPDQASIEAVSLVDNDHTVIIDTSTAHRTNDGWSYGFPELGSEFRNNITNGKRIAVPGCYASGFISITYPLIKSGLVPKDYPLTCFAMSGYTGAGKNGIAQYEDENRNTELDSPRQYALTQAHKHLKEMKAITTIDYEPTFSPHICDYPCGMVVSIPLHMRLLNGITLEDVQSMYKEYYRDSRLIHIRSINESANNGLMIGSNNFANRDDMEIEISGNNDRIIITSRFDNLGKGASGAAVQCLNLVIGANEFTGLNIGE